MKMNVKRTVIIAVSVVLALAAIAAVVFVILRATPENTAKRVIKRTLAYKPSQCTYFDIEDYSERLSQMNRETARRYSDKDVTDDFIAQLNATTIPGDFAKIAYDSGKKTTCKEIKLEDVTRDGDPSAVYDFSATLKLDSGEYEIAGTVILINEDGDWKANYIVIVGNVRK